MNVETWAAIVAAIAAVGAAVAAAVALYFNKRSTKAADRAADAVEKQTDIQEQLRIDAAQPYVWADVRPDEVTGTLLNLVVGNSGPTIAQDVRVKVDPPLPVIDSLQGRANAAQKTLSDGIQSLPPGRTLMWPLGQGFNLIKDQGPQACTFTITAKGPFGAVPPLTYVVDLADWRGMLDRPAGNLHQLTLAVKDLTKTMSAVPPDGEPQPRHSRG